MNMIQNFHQIADNLGISMALDMFFLSCVMGGGIVSPITWGGGGHKAAEPFFRSAPKAQKHWVEVGFNTVSVMLI